MGTFNYTDIHLFDKKGYELPLVYDSNIIVRIPSKYGNDAVFYGVIDEPNGEVTYHCKTEGTRFSESEIEVSNGTYSGKGYVVYKDSSTYTEVTGTYETARISETEEPNRKYTILSLDDVNIPIDTSEFPSTTFSTSINFEAISTGLSETQSIYLLCNRNNEFEKVGDGTDSSAFKDKYRILFYINTKEQENFRFFTTKNDEVIWSNKYIVDFNSDGEDGYRVNIGFTADEEGVYEEILYVCLLTYDNEIYPIGSINLFAEAIGEDERYRTLFTNFGIPDPKEYMDIFSDVDNNEGLVDNITLNKNSKKMFLAYNEIFPYAGTYKALTNAIKVLGYEDIFFKEWYKEIGKSVSNSSYISFDVAYKADGNANSINNVSIEERISLRKLNWLSMVYRINEELDESVDKYGFPLIKKVYGYNDSEIIVKLISLKKWLEKYIIGLNCRIIDVGGEGIYFERYKLDAYGTYQQQYTWENEFHISPYVIEETNGEIIDDSSANIYLNIGVDNNRATIEDFSLYTIKDLCSGYFVDSTYHDMHELEEDTEEYPSIFVGTTFDMIRDMEGYQVIAKSKLNDFVFSHQMITDDIDSSVASSKLIVSDDEMFFDPNDIYNGHDKSTIFKKLPLIQIERGNIRKMSSAWSKSVAYSITPVIESDTAESYIIQDKNADNYFKSVDYISLLPPTYVDNHNGTVSITPRNGETFEHAVITTPTYISGIGEEIDGLPVSKFTYGLRYTSDNPMGLPIFSIIGYQLPIDSFNITPDEEFYIEIMDGKMIFEGENGEDIYLNFHFDTPSKKQTVEVNIVYKSDEFNITSYKNGGISVPRFISGNNYASFVSAYMTNPESVIFKNTDASVNVNYAGTYTIDVMARDIYNNMFAARCRNNAIILAPSFEITAFTDETVPNGVVSSEDLLDTYVPFALYRPNYLVRGIKPVVDSSTQTISISYPTYSHSIHTPNSSDVLHLLGISDMYKINALDDVYTSTNIKVGGKNMYEGYSLILSRNGFKSGKVIDADDRDAMNLMNSENIDIFDPSTNQKTISEYMDIFSISEKNYADVNVIMYNELGGYPMFQTYGTMINDKPFRGGYTGNYRLKVLEDSDRSYVWASLRNSVIENTKMRMGQEITDKCETMGIDSSIYANTSFVSSNISENIKREFVDSSTDTMLDPKGYTDESGSQLVIDEVYALMNGSAYNDASTLTDPYDQGFVIPYLASDNTFNVCRDICSILIDSDVSFAVNTNVINILNAEENGELLDSSIQDFLNTTIEGESINMFAKKYHIFNSKLTDKNCDIDNELILNGSATGAATILHKYSSIDESIYEYALSILLNAYTSSYTEKDMDSFMSTYPTGSKNNIYTTLKNDSIYDNVNWNDPNFIENFKLAIIGATIPFAKTLDSYIKEEDGAYIVTDDEMAAKYWNTIRFALYAYLIGWFIAEYRRKVSLKDESILVKGNTDLVPYINNTFDKFEMLYDSSLTGTGVLYSNAVCGSIIDNYFTLQKEGEKYIANGAYCFAANMTQYRVDEEGTVIDETMPTDEVPAFMKYLCMNENMLFDKSSGQLSNWVTKGKVQYSEQKDTALYALINTVDDSSTGKSSAERHYIKTSTNFNGGLSYVGQTESVNNVMPSIEDILKTKYTSLYIKPTWRSRVYVYKIDNDPSRYAEYGLDPNYDYLFVNYVSREMMTSFKPGEKIKLMFESADNNKYLGQSTYEVVGYDIFENYIIVRGAINNSYLSENEGGLWSEITDWEYNPEKGQVTRVPVLTRKKDTSGAYIDQWEYKRDGTTPIFTLSKNTSYISSEIIGNKQKHMIPVRYNIDPDAPQGSEYEYRWYYKLYAKIANNPSDADKYSTIFPISTSAKSSEKVNMYISYANHSYVDYNVTAESYEESPDGMTRITLPYDKKTRRYMDFVDDTFSILSTEFDTSEGQYGWMDHRRNSISLDDVTPAILLSGKPIYESPISDIVLKNTNYIAFKVDADVEECVVEWKVYRLVKESDERKHLFTCFNKVLYLDYSTQGIYDIEVSVYDKYGNKSTRLYKNAFKIK